jgi:hypothetical protein
MHEEEAAIDQVELAGREPRPRGTRLDERNGSRPVRQPLLGLIQLLPTRVETRDATSRPDQLGEEGGYGTYSATHVGGEHPWSDPRIEQKLAGTRPVQGVKKDQPISSRVAGREHVLTFCGRLNGWFHEWPSNRA